MTILKKCWPYYKNEKLFVRLQHSINKNENPPFQTSLHKILKNSFLLKVNLAFQRKHLELNTVVIRQLRPEFEFPAKIEMAFSQILAIST